MSEFVVTVKANHKTLGQLMSLINEHRFALIKVEAAPETLGDCAMKAINRHYVGGKRDKGIHGDELAMSILADGKVKTQEQLEKEFVARNFSALTVSPTMSLLIKAGKVKKLAKGRYIKADVTSIKIG